VVYAESRIQRFTEANNEGGEGNILIVEQEEEIKIMENASHE
jgi:hypothetical protein